MRRRRKDFVGEIPNEVWNKLNDHERGILFVIGDCLDGRFSPVVMRRRLDDAETLRMNWFRIDHGLPIEPLSPDPPRER